MEVSINMLQSHIDRAACVFERERVVLVSPFTAACGRSHWFLPGLRKKVEDLANMILVDMVFKTFYNYQTKNKSIMDNDQVVPGVNTYTSISQISLYSI